MRCPKVLIKAKDAYMAFAHGMGTVMSAIVLTAVWIIVFGCYAVILTIVRIFAVKKEGTTYWYDSDAGSSDLSAQF